MRATTRPVVLLTAVTLLAACVSGGDGQAIDPPPPSTEEDTSDGVPTSDGTDDDTGGSDAADGGDGGGPSSSVTTNAGDEITSDVEVRVAEVISDYDGVETDEGTELTVPAEVLFAFDEATILPEAEAALADIVEVLAYYKDDPVEIVGHTDSDGSSSYNRELSEHRAQAVADHLTAAGLDAGRFTVEGRGEDDPAESNDTDAGRQANRRVEILIRGVAPPDVDPR